VLAQLKLTLTRDQCVDQLNPHPIADLFPELENSADQRNLIDGASCHRDVRLK